jgi:hypothetical protein
MRIYLEVDGVINAPQAPGVWGAPTFDSIDFDQYVFVWSTAAVDALVELCERTGTEIVWVSGWNEQIHILSRLLGFGHFGADARTLESVFRGATPYEKADAVLLDLEENPLRSGDKWVWMDPSSDDVMQSEDYVYKMLTLNGYVPPLTPGLGITPSLMQHLINVAGEVTGKGKGKGKGSGANEKREGGK